MVTTIVLKNDYDYSDYRISGVQETVIDATAAHWSLANFGSSINRYPVFVDRSRDVSLIGGTVTGHVPLNMDWRDAYVNAAAVAFREGSGHMVVKDWTITQTWDGLRFDGTGDFLVEDVWINRSRDDAVENDDGLNGTIRNSLFENVFVGVSLGDEQTKDQRKNVVTLDHVLIGMDSYLYKGTVTHGPIFKTLDGVSPHLKLYDSVFAIEDVNHFGQERLGWAWNRTIDAHGNTFLNLSNDPLPKSYPLPEVGFTIIQGLEARSFWENSRSVWISANTGRDAISNPTHTGTAAAETLTGTAGNDVMLGKAGNDQLYGQAGNDFLYGQDGNDYLAGRSGADTLVGGRGDDLFRLSSASDSPIDARDVIRPGHNAQAFEGVGVEGGDRFDFRGFDADTTIAGVQKFVFGSAARGGISLVDLDTGDTLLRGNIDGDAAFEFAVVIEDGVIKAADYAVIDLLM